MYVVGTSYSGVTRGVGAREKLKNLLSFFDRNISFVTSLTQTLLKILISSLTNSDGLFLVVETVNTAIFQLFSTFPPRQPLFITAKTSLHIFVVHHCTLKHALPFGQFTLLICTNTYQ